MHYFDLTISYM